MIVLDTNVVSEGMKPAPDASVRAWLNSQVAETLYLTTVTLAELRFGINTIANGQRKQQLQQGLTGLLELFEGRILPFDTDAAEHYAELAGVARRAGRGFPLPDAYIAAIAGSHRFGVATRDTSPLAVQSTKLLGRVGMILLPLVLYSVWEMVKALPRSIAADFEAGNPSQVPDPNDTWHPNWETYYD